MILLNRVILVAVLLETTATLMQPAASFQILACYLSSRTDSYDSIVLVDRTVDRQVGFSQLVI